MLDELDANRTNEQDYLDGWICFCIFIREVEKKFNDDQAKEFLIDNLLIN